MVRATILGSPGLVELHLSTRASNLRKAEDSLDLAVEELVGALGRDVYTTEGLPLELVVGNSLRSHGWRIALAESCTGGLLAARLTDVPGSSA